MKMKKIIHKCIIPKEVRNGIWQDYVRRYVCTGYLLNPRNETENSNNVHVLDRYGSYFWKNVNCKKCLGTR